MPGNLKAAMFAGASGILTIMNSFVRQISIEYSTRQNTTVEKINVVPVLIELVNNSGHI